METVIKVFEAARRLARAHGHQWAASAEILRRELAGVEPGPGAPMAAVAAIDAATVAACDGEPPGLGWGETCPTLRVGPAGWSLVHTTGSGRTSWTLSPTGSADGGVRVAVDVSRPAGPCLHMVATVTGGEVEVTRLERAPEPWVGERVEALPRHVHALAGVLAALVGPVVEEWSEEAERERESRARALLLEAAQGDALRALVEEWAEGSWMAAEADAA